VPLVTVTVRKPKSAAFKSAVLDAVHGALVASGVPGNDRFHRVLEMDEADIRYDASYPDVVGTRSPDFVLVQIVLSVGRSVKVKRKILADLLESLRKDPGLDPEDVMVVFQETQWENWSFAGGRLIHAG
jgi:phenylpyruvate tautomerase PptA (4-oxalocrotonate tautomerase family)